MLAVRCAFWAFRLLAIGSTLSAVFFLATGLGIPGGSELAGLKPACVRFGLAQVAPAALMWAGVRLHRSEVFGGWREQDFLSFPAFAPQVFMQMFWLSAMCVSAVFILYAVFVYQTYQWRLVLL